MQNYNLVKEVFDNIYKEVRNSNHFIGIEIAALKKGNIYTDNLCVRVLVNSPNITHEVLNIPTKLNGISIIIEHKIIEPL